MGKLKSILIIFITVLSFSSCEDSENILPLEKTYIVASKRVNCQAEGVQKCYIIKEKGTQNWQYFYSSIIGFSYTEGFEYELLISEKEIDNPPQDASSIEYTLLKVISKIEKTSENLPK